MLSELYLAYTFCTILMNVTTVFQVLEYVNDCRTIGYGGHFVFQN